MHAHLSNFKNKVLIFACFSLCSEDSAKDLSAENASATNPSNARVPSSCGQPVATMKVKPLIRPMPRFA
jgi:hypothetical protein